MARIPYKWFNINRIGPRKRVNGKSGKAETTIFWPHCSGKCRTVALTVLEGIMEGLRHQGRPRRQWIHDIEEWTGCEYIQLKEMSQDRAQWRRKILEWSSAVANHHRGRSTSEWVSELFSLIGDPNYFAACVMLISSFQFQHWPWPSSGLAGKPGNVREFDSCQGNIRDFTKSQGSVRQKILAGQSGLKLFIVSCI